MASFMQFFLVNFLNECAVALCAAITQRDSAFRAVLKLLGHVSDEGALFPDDL